jgi:UDP-N-acetylglucosamine acyltransferase
MPHLHPTGVIDPRARLSDDVRVGPYAVIDGPVELGPRTVVHSHCVIKGPCRIGADCEIGPAAHVGTDAQHLNYDRTLETWLVVGDRTVIRESASVHRATKAGIENATRVGDRCLLMACSHVGHDTRLGNGVILANAVLLAGHVTVGDGAFLAGGAGVHQFVRIGRLAIMSGNEIATRDVPPFSAVRYGGLKGYNAIGCKRAGIPRESIFAIRQAFRCYHSHRTLPAAVAAIRHTCPDVPEVREMLDFIAASKRGIHPSLRFLNAVRGGGGGGDGADD